MSNPYSDEDSLLRSAGYFPEPSPLPSPTLQPQDHHQTMQSSSSYQAYSDPAPRYTEPASASRNYESDLAKSAELGSNQRAPSSRGSRDSSVDPFEPPSSIRMPDAARYSDPFENSYVENASGTPRWNEGEDVTRGRSIFSGPDLPSVTLDEAPRAIPMSGRTTPMNNESHYDNDNDNLKHFAESARIGAGCPAHRDIHSRRFSWLSISILTLSIYSTLLSGLWLGLAIAQPRYGRTIHSGGSISPSTASILFALLAKTVEISFVTVFVTFLGQVLSRRSLIKNSRGVTIAEMTMRSWVIQPGFMITHFQNLQHTGLTFLGLISLTAAIISLFYTTASDAIVSPTLRFGKTKDITMYGLVQSSYANPPFVSSNCQTPITIQQDPLDSGDTCLSYQHAGQAFLATWTDIEQAGGAGAPNDLSKRPAAPAMLFDNTTVTGSWVALDNSNLTAAYEQYQRIVNNVTLSIPHAGLFAAARDQKNNILQPEELGGLGEYKVEASVVSPTVNVLCANMNKTAASPLIYVEWPNAQITNDSSMPGQALAWSGYQDDIQPLPGQSYLNSTDMDDIFGWGEKYGRQPPVFPMFPIQYNAITNISVVQDEALYTIFKANDTATSDYTICELRSYLSTSCSSMYNVSGLTGGQMSVNCDENNPLAYDKSVPNSATRWQVDWRNMAQQWMLSMSLNTGLTDANSSTARLLSQMIQISPESGSAKLTSLTPSISELMAVMVGSTLLLGTTDTTFYHEWSEKYPSHILNPGQYESFNASMSSQEYTSGLQQKWQAIFYIVLGLVFLTNVFCLIYLIVRHGLVTDFTEPSNLFALAVNSPPSQRLGGSCGSGPEGRQLDVDWHVMAEDESHHFYIREGLGKGNGNGDEEGFELRQRRTAHPKSISSYSKLSGKSSSRL